MSERAQLTVLPDKVRAARLRNTMTCAELAQKAGVSKATIHKYENGDPTPVAVRTIRAVAEALGVKTHELVRVD